MHLPYHYEDIDLGDKSQYKVYKQTIKFDSNSYEFDACSIGSDRYFKLLDLSSLLGFDVIDNFNIKTSDKPVIGHASSGSHGIYWDEAGDQTGKEVCMRFWYDYNWNFVIRAKDPVVAERMALVCESACMNENLGYDQMQRNSFRTELVKKDWDITKIDLCECDCSSFMSVCAEAAGVDIWSQYYGGNAPTTYTMKVQFGATGAFDIITDKEVLSNTNLLQRGDILVNSTAHTVMILMV